MKKLKSISKIKFLSLFYIILAYSLVVLSGTYAFQALNASDSITTEQAGCFQVNYTGQNLTSSDISTTDIYSEGARATVTLSKASSCKIYTEANIYLKTNNTTTAPITTVQALKYKVFSGEYQISEGTVTSLNDYLLATVPLTDTSTVYTIYLWIDNVISAGYYTDTSYSGYIYANSTQTSTIEGNYLVNFDLNNGSNLGLSKTVTNGSTYGWLPTPTKNGYTFTGWKLSSTSITSSSTVTQSANHTLVAQWSTASYTVRFNANGGNVSPSSMTVTYGGTYSGLPTPTRGGSTFLGWHGKNLLNLDVPLSTPSSTTTSNTTKRTFLTNSYVSGLSFNNYYGTSSINSASINSGTININSKNSGYGLGFPFFVNEFEKYTLSFDLVGHGLYSIMYYQSDGTLIDYYYIGLSNNHVIKDFTIPSNTFYLVVLFASYANEDAAFSNIQLEYGDTATAFEPYYITDSTTVTRDSDHILYAMWG